MAARVYHGIHSAKYDTSTPASGTAINNLVAEGSRLTPRHEGPKDVLGNPYYGKLFWDLELVALDLTAYAALLTAWKAGTKEMFYLVLDNSATVTWDVTTLFSVEAIPIEGAAGGRADGFILKATIDDENATFST